MALKIWSQRKTQPQKIRMSSGKYNPVMQKLMGNKKIAKALDSPKEQKEFYGMVRDLGKEGVSQSEMRELADRLAHGHEARTISNKEGSMIAKGLQEELYPGLKKFKKANSKSKTISEQTQCIAPKSKTTPFLLKTASPRKEIDVKIDSSNFGIIKKISPKTPIKPSIVSLPQKNLAKNIRTTRRTTEKLLSLEEKKIKAAPVLKAQKEPANTPLINRKITINEDQFHEAKAASTIEYSGKPSPRLEALVREKRRKMLAGDNDEKSEDEKGNFFSALSATKKNKSN